MDVNNLASSQNYLEFILEQLSELNDISYRAMMGEFILYTIVKKLLVGYSMTGYLSSR